MPTVPQSELAVPKSWDEFEDIVWDLYRRVWGDPNAERYGRKGQAQQGVDIYGRPARLGGRYVGVQCKRYADGELTRKVVDKEIAKAEGFSPPLAEYVIATTAHRDAKLQQVVREINEARQAASKFSVHVVFWEDLCNHLYEPANNDLLQKHYGNWINRFRHLHDGQEPPYGADIRLEAVDYGFSHSAGSRRSRFRGIRSSPRGFNNQGLPDWGTLWANVKFKNHGREKGAPDYELDEGKTKLPAVFDRDSILIEFYPPLSVAGRTSTGSFPFFLDVLFTERDPCSFAETLKHLVESGERYQVVIRYRTIRVDGESDTRELLLEGDFQDLHRLVVEHWNNYGFKNLADLARLGECSEDGRKNPN
jgi:hypothetical protein